MGSRTKRLAVSGGLAGGAAMAGRALARRYRRDLAGAWERLAAVERRVVATPYGDVEYAERGSGRPLLVVHGIFHGCDGGLMSAGDLPQDRRLIAPSRFGYLGSPLPAGATVARQADVYAAMLDELGVDHADVVGISAGTTSALQFALRHPDRVNRLVVVSGNLPGNPTAVAPPAWARLLYADVPLWLMKVFARRQFLHIMGVPRNLMVTADVSAFLDQMADSIFPVAPRAAGAAFDAFVSNPDVNTYPLEEIEVPALVVHARDDPLTSFAAAENAARRIPGARLVAVPSGGHLLLGQDVLVRPAIAAFLAEPVTTRDAGAEGGEDGDAVRAEVPSFKA